MRRLFRWTVVMLVALHTVLAALPGMAQGNSRAVDESEEIRNRMWLRVEGEAIGQKTVRLALAATPLLNAPALQVRWEMGAEQMIDGPPLEVFGALAAGETARQMRTVVLPGQGTYPLLASATYQPYEGAQYGASVMLFALVDAAGAVTLTDRDPHAVSPMRSIMPTEVVSVEPYAGSAGTDEPHDDPCFAVSGTVTREDRMNTSGGRQGPVTVPVRNALVEMREEDLLFDDSYGEDITDNNGAYSFNFCDDDGIFDDDLEIYLRLRAELFVGDFSVVEVEDSSYIDETYEFDSSVIEDDGDGGAFTINFALNTEQSGIFNIADAILDAWNFWNASGGAEGDDDIFDYSAEVHWEAGYGDAGSYYNGYTWDEITIADGPADPDQWDDSVIMHEWGHQADDNYGCDDNPGGPHSFGQILNDPELAWSEGYPDYWQSAVRNSLGVPSANFYIDADAAGNNTITVNLESVPGTANASVEDAVAAMLWDLSDSTNDGQDRTGFGHDLLQQVYTHPEFESNGDVFDDTCTAFVYLVAWKALDKATDAATAAAITQNIGLANPFGVQAQTAASDAANRSAPNMEIDASTPAQAEPAEAAGAPVEIAAANLVPGGTAEDYIWWQRVTMVADNSPSMAGTKFSAVKTVMQEQVNDLSDSPAGVEFGLYTFNNSQLGSQEVLRGQFYPDAILPGIQGLATTTGGVEPCKVNAFSALASAVQDKREGEAWLYTDGETTLGPGVEAMQQMLTTRGLRGSFVMMGGCSSPPDAQPDTYGLAYSFLGKAANGTQPSGIVPYLLTAIASGGNFLFVDEAQLSDAADILRAQLSHSAGAGRWSDYVSTGPTYTWDRLTSWEYNWVDDDDADDDDGDGLPDIETLVGQPIGDTPVEVVLPQNFPVYTSLYSRLRVYDDGYYRMGGIPTGPVLAVNRYLNLLRGNLGWETIICAAGANAPHCGPTQQVLTQDAGDWYAVTLEGNGVADGTLRAYQALFNKHNGEIRFQYLDVPDGDAGEAVIGVSSVSLLSSTEVVVSNMDDSGADPGTGYKFVPMPPQPSKTFTVPVDAQTRGVGFLLTGYSGSFADMVVSDPGGAPVDCGDADDVLCLNLGLVQYVQVDVNGRNGDWHAVVSPGSTGEGTFSFSAMGASLIKAQSPFSHQLALGKASPIAVRLGAPAAGNQLTAWLQRPDGSRMGSEFTLFDDGAHGDDRPGDGLFALADFTPPDVGAGYLWVRGTVSGTVVQRSDPAPYNFQPLDVEGPAETPYLGAGSVDIHYTITNLGDVRYCYNLPVLVPDGWLGQWQLTAAEILNGFCLDPDESQVRALRVTPTSLQNPAPSGSSGEIVVTFSEKERGQIVDSAVTLVKRYNPPARVEIENHATSSYIRPNNTDTVTLTVGVFDAQNYPVADGTLVDLAATLGTVMPVQGPTANGQLEVIFTAGNMAGDAQITAMVGALEAATVVHIQEAYPDELTFKVTPLDLRNTSSASMVATVRDEWGDPVVGQIIRIGAEDDGDSGEVTAAILDAAGNVVALDAADTAQVLPNEVVTLTTNAQGQAAAVFTKLPGAQGAEGTVGVRAEVLFDEGSGLRVALYVRQTILLTDAALLPRDLYLPLLERQE